MDYHNTGWQTSYKQDQPMQCKRYFIGLPSNQQGYLIYMPQSNQIAVSMDVSFNEAFTSAIVLTWTPFQDAIGLHPNESFLADDYDTLEHTGSAEQFPSMFEEGNENVMLSRLIQNQTQDNNSKETPKIVEDEEENTPQNFDDSSDDSSTELDRDEQGYTKPLDISKLQTQEKIPELSEQEIIPDKPTVRNSSRNRKHITRFEDNPDT